MNKRRDLLKLGGRSLALAGLGLAGTARAADLAGAGVAAAATNAYRWSEAGARALLGQQFWLNDPQQGALSLTLNEVRVPPPRKRADGSVLPPGPLQQFTLVFAGPAGAAITGGSYEMDHAQIGRFALFLTPSGQLADANLYRAEFSLLA